MQVGPVVKGVLVVFPLHLEHLGYLKHLQNGLGLGPCLGLQYAFLAAWSAFYLGPAGAPNPNCNPKRVIGVRLPPLAKSLIDVAGKRYGKRYGNM